MSYGGNLTSDGATRCDVIGAVLPPDAARESKQLPDNHQVTVSNVSLAVTAASLPLPAGAATAANQLPDNHQVTVSNLPASQTTVIGDGPNLDAFSRLRVSDPQQLFQTQVQYDLDPVDMEGGATGTGVAPAYVANVRMAELSVGAGTGTSFFQSYQYVQYQPGKSQLIFVTFTFGTGVTNVTKDVGYFDSNDGIFLRQNGTSGLQVVLRSSTSGSAVDTVVNQAAFNLDVLDGTGLSGLTFDELGAQILIIDLQFLGHGRVRCGLDIDGKLTYFHEFRNANNLTVPYMRTAALPVQYLLTATASAAPATFRAKCSSVVSEGGASNVPTVLSATPQTTVAVASGTRTHAMSIRPRLLFQGLTNRSTGTVEGIYILNTTNTPVFFEICYGTTFSVAPTYADINTTYSAYEYGTGGTYSSLASGVVTDTGFVTGNNRGAEGGVSFQEFLPITLDRSGAHRDFGTWTLLLTGLGGTSTCYVSLRLREFR